MSVIVNCDKDIISLGNRFGVVETKKLEYVYTSAGFRLYMNLGECEERLFLEIRLYDHRIQFEWLNPKSLFTDILGEFGFKYHSNNHFVYPDDITARKENDLIEKLIGFIVGGKRNYFSLKYGLR